MLEYFKKQIKRSTPLDSVAIQNLIDARNKQHNISKQDLEYFRNKFGTYLLWYGVKNIDQQGQKFSICKIFSDEVDTLHTDEYSLSHFASDLPMLIKLK
jgi:hypothetical protein